MIDCIADSTSSKQSASSINTVKHTGKRMTLKGKTTIALITI